MNCAATMNAVHRTVGGVAEHDIDLDALLDMCTETANHGLAQSFVLPSNCDHPRVVSEAFNESTYTMVKSMHFVDQLINRKLQFDQVCASATVITLQQIDGNCVLNDVDDELKAKVSRLSLVCGVIQSVHVFGAGISGCSGVR